MGWPMVPIDRFMCHNHTRQAQRSERTAADYEKLYRGIAPRMVRDPRKRESLTATRTPPTKQDTCGRTALRSHHLGKKTPNITVSA